MAVLSDASWKKQKRRDLARGCCQKVAPPSGASLHRARQAPLPPTLGGSVKSPESRGMDGMGCLIGSGWGSPSTSSGCELRAGPQPRTSQGAQRIRSCGRRHQGRHRRVLGTGIQAHGPTCPHGPQSLPQPASPAPQMQDKTKWGSLPSTPLGDISEM